MEIILLHTNPDFAIHADKLIVFNRMLIIKRLRISNCESTTIKMIIKGGAKVDQKI